MKKTALLLCFVILTLIIIPSCSGDGTIVGTWYGEMDLSQVAEEMFGEVGEDFQNIRYKDLTLGVIYDFREDGTYRIKADEESKKELTEKLLKKLRTPLLNYLDALAEETGVDYKTELEKDGMTLDDFLRGLIESVDVTKVLGAFEAELCYKTEGGKLYSADTKEALSNASFYINYEVYGNKLRFVSNSREEQGKEAATVDMFWEILKETKFKRK